MERHALACVIILSLSTSQTDQRATEDVLRVKRDHVPPLGVPTFRRDAVERVPDEENHFGKNAAYRIHEEFGSRSLPLRVAVESVPDSEQASQRLPLRDAVEKRLPPDEATQYSIKLSHREPIIPENVNTHKNAAPSNIYGFPYGNPLQQAYQPQFAPSTFYSQNAFIPQNVVLERHIERQTFYSPLQMFRRIVGDYTPVQPYRVDNAFQQLISHPSLGRGRSLKFGKKADNLVAEPNTQRIVCYVQGQSVYRREPLAFKPEDIDPFACSHIIYAYASLDPHSFTIISNDDEFDIVQGGYRSVTGLKRFNPRLKVLISIGGGRKDTPHRFSSMVSSASRRRDFIKSAISLVKQYDFDGIDIHWEYPGAHDFGGHTTDKEYFNVFLEEISEIFKQRGWLLTVSVPGSRFRIEDGYNPSRLGNIVDFVNIEAFNFYRDRDEVADHHSNLYNRQEDSGVNLFLSVDYAVQFWLKNGLPREKLVVGLPFFGRSFTLKYINETMPGSPITGLGNEGFYTQHPGLLAYFEICDTIINDGWFKGQDSDGNPYVVNGNQWVSYDDEQSISRKISYIKDQQLGGVHIWSADMDDFKGLCGEKWPLLSAVNKFLRGSEPIELEEDISEPAQPYGTCQNDGFYSDPKNCASYYICKNGLSYHLSCGNKLMYDSETGKCGVMSPSKCRPGQSVFIPHHLKDISNMLEGYRALATKDAGPKVVCYMTNWAFYRKAEGKFVPEHIDQQLCTHIVYAFASLDPERLLMKEFDPWADLDNNLYERVTSLKDTQVLLSLGGWTDSAGDKYSRLVSNGSARRKFVVGAVSFLRKHGFRGLHFDWNYPICWQSNCRKGPANDKPNFTKLMQELRKEFDKENPPLLLAAAISGYKEVIDVAYDFPALGEALDFMSVMTYDYHGAWERQTGHVSPLYQEAGDKYPQYNTDYTMEYIASKGAPREKLLVGIPFYGQTFTLAKSNNYAVGTPSSGPGEPGEYTKQPGMLAYYEICNKVRNQRWIVNKNTPSAGPYAYHRTQWVGYEDVDSVKTKAGYVTAKGFGGVVAWTIDLDDFSNRCCGGTFPLLRAVNEGLGRAISAPTATGCERPPEPSTPAPPETTTGIDSGASNQEHNHHWTSTTTRKTTTSPWWTTKSTTTTQQPETTTTTPWWQSTTTTTKKTTTSSWWTTTKKPSKKPTAVTAPWWSSTTSSTTTTTRQPVTAPWWSTTRPTTTTSTASPDGDNIVPPPAVVMPEVDNPPKTCEPGQHFPDQMNCNAYYRCILGELRKQYCAGGLHWNREKNICDWPSEAKCGNSDKRKPSYNRPTTTTPSNPWQTQSSSSNYHTRTTPRPPSPTTVAQVTRGCRTGEYYPHSSCNKFYVCVNDMLVEQSCGPALHWNIEKGMCDWAFKVGCQKYKNVAEKFTTVGHNRNQNARPYSTCEGNTFAPYAGDCTQYLHCLWNQYEVFQCAPGLHWNHDKQICDWPETAKCTDNTITDTDDIPLQPTQKPVPTKPPYRPTITTTTQKPWQPDHTTSYPEWKPPSTTTESSNSWEWHPPIPPPPHKPEFSEPLKPYSGYFKLVCYFTNWAWYRNGIGKYQPEEIDDDMCTHIVYGFAVLDFSNLVIKAHDSWADFDNQFYKRVVAYKAKGIKVSLAIGGWNDSQGDKYSRLVNNPSARRRFIEHVLKFLEKHNFDGLDLDWEYPKCWQVDCKKGPDSDKPAFSAFVKELKEAFRPKGYLLSAAVSPSKQVIDKGYDVPVMGEYLDWVAVMTYDFHGQWDKQTGHVAPLFYHPQDEVPHFNSNFSINYWIDQGVPRRKIVMGMPLYGQAFRLENENDHGLNAKAPGPGEAGEYTRAAGFLAYYEICHNIKQGWTVVQDPKRRMGPYAYKGNQWVSYDDKEMLRIKSEYIRRMDLGGGMIWALDLDDFKNRCGEGRHPLLTTIRNVLADAGTGQQVAIAPIEDGDEEQDRGPPVGEMEAVESEEPTNPENPPPTIEHSSLSPIPPKQTTHQSLIDPTSEYKVVCYFTNWAWYRQGKGKYLPSDIDPDLCTHIVYGFAVLNGDQQIIKPHDTWADYDNKFYEKVTAFKKKGIKVLIAIGGWNDSAGDKYSKLVNNPQARRRFIAHVVDFIEEHNFDGLDLDWEYPKCWQVDCNKGPATDKPAFADFVRELHDAFRPKGWLLSAAVSPSKRVIDAGYDVPTLSKYLDWIAVMCYDYHGQWDKVTGHVAPMYAHPDDIDATFNTNFTINYWIEKGADRKKLVMGMPMYGQSFSLADRNDIGLNAPTYGGGEAGEETRARGFLAYYEICENVIKKDWTVVRDRKGRIGPYAHKGDQWVSFDDIGMIRHKSEYIKAMGLGGGMIWALDLDDFKNLCHCEEYPLLRTINRVLRGYSIPPPKCILGKTPSGILTTKPPTVVTMTASTTTTTTESYPIDEPEYVQPGILKPCGNSLFVADEMNCNQYYLCNQGFLQVQVCPSGLYWNKDHCDWPENTACHPEATTMKPVENEVEVQPTEGTYLPPEPPKGPEIMPIDPNGYKVICYFTNWAWYRQGDGKYLPEDIDPSLCTHINYGFAVLDSSSLTIKPHDSWADIDNGFYKKVVEYKSRGIKVLIAIGGWNDSLGDKYSRLVNDPQARARFIAHVLKFIEEYGFDGLDLDWEYPKCWQVDCSKGPDSDKQGFAALVRELSAAFKPKGLLLSTAVSPSKMVIDAGYDVPSLSANFDWIAVMTYDFHGHWDKQTGHVAPLYYYPGDAYDYFNANFSLNYWIEKGADPKKIIMGMPLYGQSFSLADSSKKGLNEKSYGPGEAGEYTRAGGFLAFYEICEKVKRSGWMVTRDPQGRIGPYATSGNQWVSYDDISEIKRKSQLVKDLGLGGGMVWALDLDDFRNKCGCGKHPLLKTLNNELRGTPSDIAVENCT